MSLIYHLNHLYRDHFNVTMRIAKNHVLMIDEVKMRPKKKVRGRKSKNDKAIASDSISHSIMFS